MDHAKLLRLKKIASEIKGFAELYDDLSSSQNSSKEMMEIVRLKMEYCREQVLKLSIDLKNMFHNGGSEQITATEPPSAIGRQMMKVVEKMLDYEAQKNELLSRLEKVFVEYHAGKYTYFEYSKQLDSVLKGKQKEEWLESYEGNVHLLLNSVLVLNNKMFYSAYNIMAHREMRMTRAPVEIKPVEMVVPELAVEEAPMEIPAIVEPIEAPEVQAEKMPGKTIATPVTKEAPVIVQRPEEHKAIYETPEEEKEVEDLLSKLKSGEVKATPSIMKGLVESLKKQKTKERTDKEMTLDPSLVGEVVEEEF